jgi:hypothetical protein
MLICKFASPRSDRQRILRWIGYLEEMRRRHGIDADDARLLDNLSRQAHGWLTAAADAPPAEA